MKFTFLLLTMFFIFTQNALACSWAPQIQKVSEYTEGKIIFWGRAVKTEWKPQSASEFGENTVTYVDVIKPLQGKVSSRIKIRHDNNFASCGISYPIGYIRLFVVRPKKNGEHSADEILVYSAPTPAVVAYFQEQIDITVAGSRLDILSCAHSAYDKFTPECISEEKVTSIHKIFQRERKVVSEMPSPWWSLYKRPRKD